MNLAMSLRNLNSEIIIGVGNVKIRLNNSLIWQFI